MKKTPWIIMMATFAVFTGVGVAARLILPAYTAQINQKFNIVNWKTVEEGKGDEDTQYFKTEFASIEEQVAEENRLCTELEAEGAVLLKNDNGTLPFKSTDKFSLFSTSSADPIYGGTGSGAVSANDAVNLRKAMNAEFGSDATNLTLFRHYLQDLSAYRRVNARTTGGSIDEYRINEAPWNEVLTDDVKASIPAFPNAIVVLSRSGGEGNDLPLTECADGTDGNYLLLNQNEKDMLLGLKQLKSEGKINKIVVLLNGSNALQLDFLFDEAYGIDAATWIGGVGTTGMTAVAELLSGKRNFSGRLSDTFLKDNLSAPSIVNFGLHAYTNSAAGSGEYKTGWVQYNMPESMTNMCNENYIVYQEGIYIGYRYFETRYADMVMGQGNTAGYDYSKDVAYPFGFGESYTKWSYSNFNIAESGDDIVCTLRVSNTGEVAGKHAVEIYASGTYTDYDKDHHVEKSAIQLAGFTKTGNIAPGAHQDVEVVVHKRDLASYDVEGKGTFILDGDYHFTVGKNAHDANNNVLTKLGFGDKTDAAGDANLVKTWSVTGVDDVTASKSVYTGAKIENAFAHADLNRYEGTSDQKITYLSRSDWKGTYPTSAVSLKITPKMWEDGLDYASATRDARVEKMKKQFYPDLVNAELPTMGKPSGLTAIMFRENEDINGDAWNRLIEQASYDEITKAIYKGFHQTEAIGSIGLPGTKDENGPQGFTAGLIAGGDSGNSHGMAYTSEDVMASTRNVELLRRMGECIAEDCMAASGEGGRYAGLYGPGANIHRNSYCGRNFEYYSEDPLLSAKMQEPEVRGIQSKGVYVFTKHFALNDQESGRYGLGTWANEQSIRELYIKGFEGTAAGGGSGVMSSFNRMGVIWAGNDYSLMTRVLRDEWGLKGMAITDCSVFAGYMDIASGVLAGQDIWDGSCAKGDALATLDKYANDPVVTRAVQRAGKRIAYSVSHSHAMNGLSSSAKIVTFEEWYLTATFYLGVVSGVLALGSAIMIVVAAKSKKKA